MVKSGTDFREFTEITVDFSDKSVKTKRHEVTSEVEEDVEIKKECEKYMGIFFFFFISFSALNNKVMFKIKILLTLRPRVTPFCHSKNVKKWIRFKLLMTSKFENISPNLFC